MDEPPERAAGLEREKKVAADIAAYLNQHPRAMDTVEGVVGWWLPGDPVRADLATTRKVLEQMAESGYLVKIGVGDQARYGLHKNPAH